MDALLLRRRAMMAAKKSRLPSAYQEVEYLDSSGTQYIDTGETYIYGYKVNIEILDRQYNSDRGYLGWWNNLSQNNIQTYRGNLIIARGTNNANYLSISEIFNGEIIVDGLNISASDYSYSANVIPPDVDISFTLFGYNRISGEVNCLGKSRIRSAIFFNENHNTTHNFIPCYRRGDNKPGMYDIVSNTFYTNAGTGEFTVGPDVN